MPYCLAKAITRWCSAVDRLRVLRSNVNPVEKFINEKVIEI